MRGKCVILCCTIVGPDHHDKYSIPGSDSMGSRKMWGLHVIKQECNHKKAPFLVMLFLNWPYIISPLSSPQIRLLIAHHSFQQIWHYVPPTESTLASCLTLIKWGLCVPGSLFVPACPPIRGLDLWVWQMMTSPLPSSRQEQPRWRLSLAATGHPFLLITQSLLCVGEACMLIWTVMRQRTL